MLSVILYGRNDDHGYNYHKRLSVSINAIAQLLTEPGDEILFTDYNSPNDFPTVVEAIRDTLTPRAKELIRVFRVRPEQHRQFSKETSLPLLEPVARNVAIRRSNPANKWVLSTNADMLFVPKMEDESLSSIVSILEDGFYSAPRFELPEQFWEMVLDRMDPNGNLRFLREKCRNLRLNTVVKAEGFIQYDNPGDFQLLLRKDLLEMGGFDERMLKGWHVDANLCKRASLLIKRGGSLEDRLITFHCNHTQKASVLHSKVHTENDWSVFVDNAALTPRQPVEDWGLAREEVEEVDFKETGRLVHVKALAAVLEGSLEMEEKLSIGR